MSKRAGAVSLKGSWDDVYLRAVAAGHDHGSAAYMADDAENKEINAYLLTIVRLYINGNGHPMPTRAMKNMVRSMFIRLTPTDTRN